MHGFVMRGYNAAAHSRLHISSEKVPSALRAKKIVAVLISDTPPPLSLTNFAVYRTVQRKNACKVCVCFVRVAATGPPPQLQHAQKTRTNRNFS